ncbi:MAG: excinuclease ABC subunit UvrA [Elusimicrobia bacterium]|nr:excinuclease ABC subunit UvrA [Elusimicrobiota bacterium]
MDVIRIVGARQHNLKDVSLNLPRGKMTVVTGLSGSGKSSLAFDTLYAEGQRRYVESLSAYARQFLELMEKPDVDLIEGLSPAISIEQRNPSRNPRSTVATVTEIYDYFRLLYARAGDPHCPRCGKRIHPQSASAIVKEVRAAFAGKGVLLLAPLIRGRTGTYEELFTRLKRAGFASVRVNGKLHDLQSVPALDRYKKQTIDLVVDTLTVSGDDKERLADSVEIALKESKGLIVVAPRTPGTGKERLFSEHHACPDCGVSLPELEPRLFSFNSPYGACAECGGLGIKNVVAESLIVPDPSLSLQDGAVAAFSNPVTTRTNRWKRSWSGYYEDILRQVCRQQGIPIDVPWAKLSKKHREVILQGGGTYKASWANKPSEYEGVIGNLTRRLAETESDFVKESIAERFMRQIECRSCRGARLKTEALAVTVGGLNIVDVTRLSVKRAREFFAGLRLAAKEQLIARAVLKEINSRLDFLVNVGLEYLTLDRRSETLAGGEAQRIHLATQIGSGLTGVLYVLDEPSIGLHPRDNTRLLVTLKRLRDIGNTLVVVEHDEETIRTADWLVDMGPGAGRHGGKITAAGPVSEVLKSKDSLTARYLRGELRIEPRPDGGRTPKGFLRLRGASQFNLKSLDADIPLGVFASITGVSGSGKSTLVHEVLFKSLNKRLHDSKEEPGAHRSLEGTDQIDKVIVVDQSPIGRTPRSNPATYVGFFSVIRDIFALVPEARKRGYKAGRFSFNVKGGRCEECKGDGTLRIQMQFLPDVYVKCEACAGRRFNAETLEVRYKGKDISEVLEMSVEQALEFFAAVPPLKRPLATLADVGLAYIHLGQPATQLSGGEAQRVKLAAELSRRATGRTLYILDEPTTGLHFADTAKLLEVLHRLVDAGNTVLVIEHNLDVVKTSDWILDLGPEGGDGGGRVVASGTPRQLAAAPDSYTGRYLKPLL